MLNTMMKIQDIITYTNKNGNIHQIEDPEKKIEKKIYNGKPYWSKTERKTKTPLFRKYVHFEKPIQNTKTRKINRKLTPFPKKKLIRKKENKEKTENKIRE